jgi:heme exporter protein C
MGAPIVALLAAAGLVVSHWFIWSYAPVEATMGIVQKIFYLHLPLAWWALVSFFTVFAASALYLARRDRKYHLLAGAAAEIGVLWSGLALVTGTLWARPIWNAWWTWDPRLTTTLIMWFVYAAYLVLRSSPLGDRRREMVCAVLGVVAFLDVPLVFLSARMWRSIHPTVFGSRGGGLDPEMLTTLFVGLGVWGVLWASMLALRCRQLGQAERLAGLVTFGEEENP